MFNLLIIKCVVSLLLLLKIRELYMCTVSVNKHVYLT